MQVRYKLDTCGVKLKLEHWHRFSQGDREALVRYPCQTAADIAAYRDHLQALVLQYFDAPAKDLPVDPPPPWEQTDAVPERVQAQAQIVAAYVSLPAWTALSSLQRFALFKLSRPSHENRNFLPALSEFGLFS